MTENLHENVDILFNAHNTFLEEEFEDTQKKNNWRKVSRYKKGNHRTYIGVHIKQ
jgi:hypothetical protein